MLKLTNVKKSFGQNMVLKGIDLHVKKGEIVTIIGPSGSGKSTLLRTINFLEQAEEGTLELADMSVNMHRASSKEKIGIRKMASMVFQNYNLFRNKTSLENVMEGLTVNNDYSKEEASKIAKHRLEQVGLSAFEESMPSQMSGGQQQRVGIARAMALRPEVILLDEPTSALDPELVGEVLSVIKTLANEEVTMLIVTHEMAFAREISDRVIFMDDGKIVDEGTPEHMFENSDNLRLRSFLKRIA